MTAPAAIRMDPTRVSLSDIQRALTCNNQLKELRSMTAPLHSGRTTISPTTKHQPPHIKVTLRKTDEILLYEQRSETALRDTEEGKAVEEDNERYEYLTVGKGRRRRTIDAEAQTTTVLCKTREINTERIRNEHVGCYVSNFEMFDTYKNLQTTTKSIELDEHKKMEVTTYKVHGVDTFIAINDQASFQLALMLTMRVLAGNVFEQQQRRFRSMLMPDPLAEHVSYRYRCELLWRFQLPQQFIGDNKKAVADMSWCPRNGDILAVAYGVYMFCDENATADGCVCIWNIKNPVNPERCYAYKMPVVVVEFSPYTSHLLAVGLSDGTIDILNITSAGEPPIARTDRRTLRSCEPIVAIRWLPINEDDCEKSRIEPLLALGRDGAVTRYRVINSPLLLANELLQLDRVGASPEGIQTEHKRELLQANRHPQGLELQLHPEEKAIYYVLTDEGCLHKCSTHYPQQHLSVLQVHEAGANGIDYSPWSPKLYLTCGNDWCVNIWLEGIFVPIISLKHHMSPVHCAYWSRTHSTIIVSLNRNSVDVWDIRRSILKPMSSTSINGEHYTSCKFSLCGRSIAVGNECGNVLMLAFEDMPFPPHYQYYQLEKAIFQMLGNDVEMKHKVKSLGFFGYAEHYRYPYKQRKRRTVRRKV